MVRPTCVNASKKSAASVAGVSLGQTLPADFQHTIYECYEELNLPGYEHEEEGGITNLPLPYRVTIDKDSRQILEIRRIDSLGPKH